MSRYSNIIEMILEKLGNLSNITAEEHREVETAILGFARDQWLVGDLKMIDCTDQYIQDNFDMVSTEFYGRGKIGGEREGWAICNGLNGTQNRMGRVPIAWGDSGPAVNVDEDGSMTGEVGSLYKNYYYDAGLNLLYNPYMRLQQNSNPYAGVGGTKNHRLTTNEMPSHSHTPYPFDSGARFYQSRNTAYESIGYATGDNFNGINGHFTRASQTGSTGSSMPHTNMQPYMVSLFIQKIEEYS